MPESTQLPCPATCALRSAQPRIPPRLLVMQAAVCNLHSRLKFAGLDSLRFAPLLRPHPAVCIAAAEVLQREYGPQADVWSLGVCLFTLLSGLLPFFGETEEQVFDMVQYAGTGKAGHRRYSRGGQLTFSMGWRADAAFPR